jgi:catechol 2,3-dioxygenase-like lactoylglutathione lyase family enzyme
VVVGSRVGGGKSTLVSKRTSGGSKAHPGVLVRGLDALADRLSLCGVEVEWDEHFPGHRRFYAHDPFGNRLEFLEPLA